MRTVHAFHQPSERIRVQITGTSQTAHRVSASEEVGSLRADFIDQN